MKSLLLAVIAAAVAETATIAVYLIFGHVGPCSIDAVAGVVWFFHMPGLLLVDRFLMNNWLATPFLIFTGMVQFFLISYCGIALWRRVHGHRSA